MEKAAAQGRVFLDRDRVEQFVPNTTLLTHTHTHKKRVRGAGLWMQSETAIIIKFNGLKLLRNASLSKQYLLTQERKRKERSTVES